MSYPTFEELMKAERTDATSRLLWMAIAKLSVKEGYSDKTPEQCYAAILESAHNIYGSMELYTAGQLFVRDCVQTESRNWNDIINRITLVKVIRLLHGAMGKVTEAGEMMDALKKHIFYGKPLDEVNLIEECGDGMWYDSIVLDALEIAPEEVQRRVIEKLRKRYPDKAFNSQHALNRDLDEERKVLEGGGAGAGS